MAAFTLYHSTNHLSHKIKPKKKTCQYLTGKKPNTKVIPSFLLKSFKLIDQADQITTYQYLQQLHPYSVKNNLNSASKWLTPKLSQ